DLERLPRWGAEVFINGLMIEAGLRIAVIEWPGVRNVRKYAKFGALRGLGAEIGMIGDAVRTLTPYGVVRQHLDLLRLSEGGRGRGPGSARASTAAITPSSERRGLRASTPPAGQ